MKLKNSYFKHLLFGVMFLILCVLNSLKISGILSCVLIVIYIYCSISKWRETVFLKYMFITFSIAFSTLGTLICEYGNMWVGEIGKIPYYNGSLSVQIFYYWLLANSIILFDNYWEKATQKGEIKLKITDRLTSNSMIKIAPIFVFIFNLALFLVVFRTPFFIVGAENRFVYQTLYLSRTVNLLKLLPSLFNAILIIPIVQDSLNGKIRIKHLFKRLIFPNVPYFLFMVWTGNKFGSYWELLCVILIPIFSIIDLKKINIGKLIRIALLVISVLIGILFLFYNLNGMDFKESSETIFMRFGCQGDLWWSAYDSVSKNGIRPNEFEKELSYIVDSIATEGASRTYGVFHLMNLFAVKSVVERYLLMGIRFSACGIELPYYCFGFLSLPIVAFIFGNLHALFVNIYINAVKEKRIIGCIAAFRLVSVTQSAISQGDWYGYTSLIPLFCLGVIIITYFIPVKKFNGRKDYRRSNSADI